MGIYRDHVVPIDERHALLPEVNEAFSKMRNAAQNDGINITICSSYRSFERQLSIWNRKWQGELPLLSLSNKKLDHRTLTDVEKIHAIMLWSALPGASRHHWGTDFDIFDETEVKRRKHDFQLITDEYEDEGPCASLSTWVTHNAATFGFTLPYAEYVGGVAREPWHLSFTSISRDIESAFNINLLNEHLVASNILGKETVLALLPELVSRYTFNKGI